MSAIVLIVELVSLLFLFPVCGGADEVTNLPPLAVWDVESRVTTGFGYRDNVLQSSVAPESSAFFNISADTSLIRFAENGAYLTFFILFDDSQYLNAPSVEYERFFSGTVQAVTPVGTQDEAGGQFHCLYQHQVLDLSETDATLTRMLVDGYTVMARPYWKHTLASGWAVQLEAEILRQIYSGDDISDYWAPAAGLRLIRSYGRRSEFSISGQSKYIEYDSRKKFDDDGVEIRGTRLVYRQSEVGSQWRYNWDKAQQWRTISKLSYMLSQDNGSGYFDYSRAQFSQQLRWKNPLWEIRINARLGWYTYPEQELGNEQFERSSMMLDGRMERRLGEHWLLYVLAEHEWNISNDTLEQYNTWTVGGGAGFEF